MQRETEARLIRGIAHLTADPRLHTCNWDVADQEHSTTQIVKFNLQKLGADVSENYMAEEKAASVTLFHRQYTQ